MKKIFLLIVIMMVTMKTNAENDNWIKLFNGKNLDGWKIVNGSADFKVEDGAIVGRSKMNTPNTFLATEKLYTDFILEYEINMDPEMNSGVQIRSNSLPEYKEGRVYGYQIEIDGSDRAWSGGIYDEARRGWLYNLECNPEGKKAYKKDEWNKYRVEAIGNNIRVWVNGIPTADLIDDMTAKGFIALQVHSISNESDAGRMIKFRDIRIITENLDEHKTPVTSLIPQVSYLNNNLTEREKQEGWKLIWDGKTTDGWRGAKLDNFPEKGWKVGDGILTVLNSGGYESRNGGDIVTIRTYKNFELEVDFKLTKGANSGIKYFVQPDLNKGEGSAIGCEFQILDDDVHPDAKLGVNGNRTLASLYDLIPANAQMFNPNEKVKRQNQYDWNRAKIVVNGSHVTHYLNGIKVVEYERGTQMWKALVAYSKYKVWPNFGEFAEGHILLQDHGDEVYFRNIKIKETN